MLSTQKHSTYALKHRESFHEIWEKIKTTSLMGSEGADWWKKGSKKSHETFPLKHKGGQTENPLILSQTSNGTVTFKSVTFQVPLNLLPKCMFEYVPI